MGLLDNLTTILAGSALSGSGNKAGGILGDLSSSLDQGLSGLTGGKGSGLLGPAALGGLAGLLLTGKGVRGGALGALLAGGGTYLWNQYKAGIKTANADNPTYSGQASPPDERAVRLVRALIYAAKSDGRIDEREQAGIDEKMQSLHFGQDDQAFIQKIMAEPLDPSVIAEGVHDEEEALELYALSCALTGADNFMERSYLDALAKALSIPDSIKVALEEQLNAPA